MDIQSSRERRIYGSATAPPDTEWLWLQQTKGKSILKDFVNGKWVTVGDSESKYIYQVTPGTPLSGNYITQDALNNTLAYYVTSSSFTQTLSEYAKTSYVVGLKSTVETLTEKLQKYVTLSYLNTVLDGYQKKLSAGTGLQMNSAGTKISVKCDATFNTESQNPVSNAVVATKLALVDTAINNANTDIQALNTNKQDKLSAGVGITIIDNEISCTGDAPGGVYYSVDIAKTPSDASNQNMTYFFSKGPLQGKGLYSTLLQDRSLIGTDGKIYVYNPLKLYYLYSDGSFDEITPQNGDITFNGNAVYYKGKRLPMPMQRYGELIYNHNILYPEASDVATFAFRTSGPFYSSNTNTVLRYNSNYIDIYEYVDVNGEKKEVLRNDGYVFEINNNNFIDLHILRIKRKHINYDDGFTSFLNVEVQLQTPLETLNVHVKFPKVQVFFKADPDIKTISAINEHLPHGISPWSSDIFTVNSKGRLVTKQVKKSQNIKYYTLNQTKRNIFYAIKYGDINSANVTLEATWSNWEGYNMDRKNYPFSDRIYWSSYGSIANIYGDRKFVHCGMQEINHSFGLFGNGIGAYQNSAPDIYNKPVFVDPSKNYDVITVMLRIRVRNNANNHAFDEIGVMELDENFFDLSNEIPAIVS